jgi:myo-inositol-1-phosphate synthase
MQVTPTCVFFLNLALFILNQKIFGIVFHFIYFYMHDPNMRLKSNKAAFSISTVKEGGARLLPNGGHEG